MKSLDLIFKNSVKLLTAIAFFSHLGCSVTQQYIMDRCNSRAYIDTTVADYLSTRFNSDAKVRTAVVPFSVPANLAAKNQEIPGLGNKLAWALQSNFIQLGTFPIVEVLNRQDWPAKKEEFYTGNFNAIQIARNAGYDLVIVGNIIPQSSINSLTSDVKLIETESGITIWSGQVTANSYKQKLSQDLSKFWLDRDVPSNIDSINLTNDLAICISQDISNENGTRRSWLQNLSPF